MWWRFVMIRGLRSGICWNEELRMKNGCGLRGCWPIAETCILSWRSARFDGLGFQGFQNICLRLKIVSKGRSARSCATIFVQQDF